MRQLIFIFLINLLFASNVFCDDIDSTTAKIVATNFYKERLAQSKQAQLKNASLNSLKFEVVKSELASSTNTESQEILLYYVFNVLENKGFVIVSADDRIEPIIGYAFEGDYNEDNLPPAFVEMMDNYKKQIELFRTGKLLPPITINQKWEYYLNGNSLKRGIKINEVGPLLTTTWWQGCYYNELCPVSDGSYEDNIEWSCGHVSTGCVATAFAQIMRYYKHPKIGFGEHCYEHKVYGNLSAKFGEANYNWDAMPDSVTTPNFEVAQLMYHVGVALDMDYGPASGSRGSRALNTFPEYFGYAETIEVLEKTDFSEKKWKDHIVNELNLSRPVYFENGGHAYICDGYQDTSYFHINWGWGGNEDGYYLLNTQNVLRAITGIQPDTTSPQSFEELTTILKNTYYGSIDWGDYDNDNDLDILLIGKNNLYSYDEPNTNEDDWVIKIYSNKGNNTFEDTEFGINELGKGSSNMSKAAVKWGDYDNDGDLDFAYSAGNKTEIYENTGNNIFTEINANIGIAFPSLSWSDYDNDGDLDLLGARKGASGLYKNVGNNKFEWSFIDIPESGGRQVTAIWGDYDNDMDLDFLLRGSIIYKNNGDGTFTTVDINGVVFKNGSADFGDYDCDGDLDIIMSGLCDSTNSPLTLIYRNDGEDIFVEIDANLSGLQGESRWGDFDNDGYLDIFFSGNTGGGPKTRLYRNNKNGTFSKLPTSYIPNFSGNIRMGDFDNDLDIDLLLNGYTDECTKMISTIYINQTEKLNSAPLPPNNLTSTVTEDVIYFNWNKATDNETPKIGLTYNIFIGTSPDSCNILGAMADLKTGFRRIFYQGNTGLNNGWKIINNLPDGKYYWSVQTIDNSFIGSSFASIDSFTVGENLATSINIVQNNDYAIYPNPANDKINIQTKNISNNKLNVTLLDLQGRVIFKQITNSPLTIIDVKNINAGNYVISIENGTVRHSEKIIIK